MLEQRRKIIHFLLSNKQNKGRELLRRRIARKSVLLYKQKLGYNTLARKHLYKIYNRNSCELRFQYLYHLVLLSITISTRPYPLFLDNQIHSCIQKSKQKHRPESFPKWPTFPRKEIIPQVGNFGNFQKKLTLLFFIFHLWP